MFLAAGDKVAAHTFAARVKADKVAAAVAGVLIPVLIIAAGHSVHLTAALIVHLIEGSRILSVVRIDGGSMAEIVVSLVEPASFIADRAFEEIPLGVTLVSRHI